MKKNFLIKRPPRLKDALNLDKRLKKIMGLADIFVSSPFDTEVEKATDEKNTTEDWNLILEICDKVNSSPGRAKDCLRSVVKRLQSQDPHIVLQAVTLLGACVKNCGKTFHLEVSSREFDTEIKKIIKKWPPGSPVGVKIRNLIKDWSQAEFKNDDQLSLMTSMWSRLRQDGIDLTIYADPTTSSKIPRSTDPDHVSSQQEVDDIAKAIELSLKESASPKTQSFSSAYPSTSLYPTVGTSSPKTKQNEPRKVRALYDFEAAEDNELTFSAGEIVHVIDDSDANWWKGCNQRGEGLFPANFVTSDLTLEAEKKPDKKGISFNETVEVKAARVHKKPEINEKKIDVLLGMLHEADTTSEGDPEELLILEEEVTEMGPLIDAELERVDRKHAQLSQLSSSLVDALGFYHTLMKEQPQHKPAYQTLPHPGHFPPRQQPPNPYFTMYHPGPPPPHLNQGPPPPHFNGNVHPPMHFIPQPPPQHFQPPHQPPSSH